MIAEILATGDEIRTGALVDTNTAHIADALEGLGVEVVRHLCVGDGLETLTAAFREIGERADIAVVTGGLGPTIDDRTAEAAALVAGVDQVLDPKALADIETFFRRRGRPVSPTNEKQARLPRGSEPLYNPVGTAPGFALTVGRCRFYCLPGVPHEMRRMLSERVLPRLVEVLGPGRPVRTVRTLSTFGLPESVVGERLAGLETAVPGITPGLRASFPVIAVRLYASGPDAESVERNLAAAEAEVRRRLGVRVFSSTGRSLAAETGALLERAGATLAIAESCTGGLIAHQLTEVPGASAWFILSAVTYANSAKVDVLGVSSETLDRCGAVHEETAREMAEGVRRVAGANYGLSTTGIAGPDGGSPEKPVGTVCIGIAGPDGASGRRHTLSTYSRTMNKRLFAATALDTLRRALIDGGK